MVISPLLPIRTSLTLKRVTCLIWGGAGYQVELLVIFKYFMGQRRVCSPSADIWLFCEGRNLLKGQKKKKAQCSNKAMDAK